MAWPMECEISDKETKTYVDCKNVFDKSCDGCSKWDMSTHTVNFGGCQDQLI